MSLIDYQRRKSLEWLNNYIQEIESNELSKFDADLDALVRSVAGLDSGKTYGYVTPTEAGTSITALQNTALKAKPIASNYLTPEEKILAGKNAVFMISDAIDVGEDHFKITISSSDNEWFIYHPHWSGLKAPAPVFGNSSLPASGKMDVPYFYQRDNWEKYHGPGGRQCNLTSHCMAAEYLLNGFIGAEAKKEGLVEPEDLYGKVLAKYGDTTDPNAHTPALKEFDIESYFSYSGSIADLVKLLKMGIPVPLGVSYKASGHYVCAVGVRPEKDGIFIHDPFGTRMGTSDNYDPTPGKFDFVSWSWLKAKWVDQGSEAGWMRVITSVNDVNVRGGFRSAAKLMSRL